MLYYVNFSKPLTLADTAEAVLFDGEIQGNRWFQFLKPFAYTAKLGTTQGALTAELSARRRQSGQRERSWGAKFQQDLSHKEKGSETPKYVWASGVCPQKEAVLAPSRSQKWPETKTVQDVNCPCQALPSVLGLPRKTRTTPKTRAVPHGGPGELTLSSQLSQTCTRIRKR